MEGKKKIQVKYPEIAEEILRRAEVDQEMRGKSQEEASWDDNIDKENTEWMKKIVDEIGWPSKSLVGESASYMAWLLVQHADHDPVFQEQCLERMKKFSDKEVETENIAYLEDRVRRAKGLPQLYGTQFMPDEQGNYIPQPIEDSEHVNERRKAMGLNSLEEYAKGFSKRK